ncbi:MAG: hypothetical protein M1839_001740 [Geoglossum umbratile]|nr:MAG: hypothetical protein M1839_001740 [Geoglossum umbratile]
MHPGFNSSESELVHFVRGNLLKTLSILVYIRWSNWPNFRHVFIDHLNDQCTQDRLDNAIPYLEPSVLEDRSFLGKLWASQFMETQYDFLPIVVKEGKSLSFPVGWRLPFVNEESVEIGSGGAASVTKETIACGQIVFKKKGQEAGSSELEYSVARKCFKTRGKFRGELEILAKLRKSLSQHRRIVLYLATITIGDKCHLLSPLADMDLENFLYKTPEASKVTLVELIAETANLAGALDFLHNNCHGLEFCMLQPPQINTIKNITVGATPKRGHGLFQAPEVNDLDEGSMGRRSDIWSFGYIFHQVLAFGLGGVILLKNLDEMRGKDVDGRTDYDDDYFYRESTTRILNPHVGHWVRNGLTSYRGEYDEVLLRNCGQLILKMLSINRDHRPHAKQVQKSLHNIAGDQGEPIQQTANEQQTHQDPQVEHHGTGDTPFVTVPPPGVRPNPSAPGPLFGERWYPSPQRANTSIGSQPDSFRRPPGTSISEQFPRGVLDSRSSLARSSTTEVTSIYSWQPCEVRSPDGSGRVSSNTSGDYLRAKREGDEFCIYQLSNIEGGPVHVESYSARLLEDIVVPRHKALLYLYQDRAELKCKTSQGYKSQDLKFEGISRKALFSDDGHWVFIWSFIPGRRNRHVFNVWGVSKTATNFTPQRANCTPPP